MENMASRGMTASSIWFVRNATYAMGKKGSYEDRAGLPLSACSIHIHFSPEALVI